MGHNNKSDRHIKTIYAENGLKVAVAEMAVSILLTAVIAALFYRSLLAFVMLPGVVFLVHRYINNLETEKKKVKFMDEYKDFLELLTGSLRAGYSMENGLLEAERSMRNLHGAESGMSRHLYAMIEKMKLRIPVEQLFNELADEEPYEEVREFASMINISKRLGGDYIKSIELSAGKISDKIMVNQEIDTMLAAKKLEMQIMSAMPMLILAFINISSPEFLSGMYKNIEGVSIMSICLVVYIFFIYIGMRIVNIEV